MTARRLGSSLFAASRDSVAYAFEVNSCLVRRFRAQPNAVSTNAAAIRFTVAAPRGADSVVASVLR